MTQRTTALIRNAVRHVRKFGIDGPRPVEELDALDGRDDLLAGLESALRNAEPDGLAATIHLVRLLHCFELADCIAEVALQRTSVLEARVEAVDTLSETGRDIPDALLETMTRARDFLAAPDTDGLGEVLAFPPGWRDAVLREWLSRPEAPAVPMLQRVLGLEHDIDLAVVRRLGDSSEDGAVGALRELAEGDDREIGKEAKRALHRLRGRGVEVQSERPVGTFSMTIRADARAEARGWVTGVDGFGGRVLWLLAPAPRGGDLLLEAVLDDEHGLRKADVIRVTRKGFREHLERLRQQPGLLVAERPVASLAALLRHAEGTALERGAELPEAWPRWRSEVGDQLLQLEPEPADPAMLATAGEDSTELRESARLLADPAFANWAVLGATAERAAEAVRSAEISTLVLDEPQRERRIDDAMVAAAGVFDDQLRQRYRRRLEAMAELLWALRRRDQARLALAAAVGFTDVADLYASHPFARALVQRGVLAAYQAVRQREESHAEPSPSVTP